MLNRFLIKLYRFKSRKIRKMILSLIYKIDKGYNTSDTIREIFKTYYNVKVGKYSMGGCFVPGALDRFTEVGRFCSLAMTCKVLNRNHPMEFKSMHGYFFNPNLGFIDTDTVEYIPLKIGHDVWIGHNAIIMPNVKSIGTGAVIAAGAVVNKNIPPYAVAVGNPARVVRYRFEKENIDKLLNEKWWENELHELKGNELEYTKPLSS